MAVRPPSLRAIAAFEAAARHESFVKAADELNLTQSAISHSIRGLEERLGANLFARRGRNVVLTSEGRALAERLRLSLTLLSQALDGMGAAEQSERLVIAAPNAFAHRILIRRCKDLAQAFPSLRVELRPDLDVGALQGGEADICIDYGAGAYAGLASRVLARDAIFPVAAPDLAVEPERLAQAELVENTGHAWALWFSRSAAQGPPRPALTVRDWDLAIAAAKAGLGVALAPESLVSEELRCGQLVRIGGEAMADVNACHVVWRGHGAKIRLVSRFVDWLLEDAEPAASGAEAPPPRSAAA